MAIDIEKVMGTFGVSQSEAETLSYIGDSVYATFDGYQVKIRTSGGFTTSRPIALEPPVMRALIDYATKHGAISV